MGDSVESGKRNFHRRRVETLIAMGRLVLSAFFLMAIWLDPSEPSRYARLTYGILTGYLIYSLLLAGLMSQKDHHIRYHLQIATHTIDLLVFSLLMFLTEGPNSPFFVFFVFLLICATLRWQWRGTMWSAVAALFAIIVLSVYPHNLLTDQNFELNRFVIRTAYLTVIATMLGFLGAYEQSIRHILTSLAEWPRTISDELQTMTKEILGHAAKILGVPRILLVWEAEEEPWLQLALWTEEGCQYFREDPDVSGTLIAEQLIGTSFFCMDAADPQAQIMQSSPAGLHSLWGSPLQKQLQERFNIKSALVSELKGQKMAGYFMALDKKTMTVDHLALGGIIAHEVASRFDNYFFMKQLKQTTSMNVQLRLARDLHDGLLQSLTGMALQLETAIRMIETEPQVAQQRIQEIQRLLANEQRDLRSHVTELRPFFTGQPIEEIGLAERFENLADRIRIQWDSAVEITLLPLPLRITRSMARDIFFVVNESLINAVRHAGESRACRDFQRLQPCCNCDHR